MKKIAVIVFTNDFLMHMYVQEVAKLKEEDLPNDSDSFSCDTFVKDSILGEPWYTCT